MARTPEIVTYDDLAYIPTPQPTNTWRPVAHQQVVDVVNEALDMRGFKIQSERFELTAGGNKMFASYQLDQQKNGHCLQIGFRNSLDKTFAVGITAGLYTLVCSNLVFAGDYKDFRKHTKNLDQDELVMMAFRAVKTLGTTHEDMLDQMDRMHATPLPKDDFKQLTFDAMNRGVLPPSQFGQFLKSWDTEAHRDGETLYSFHGAITNTLSFGSLSNIHRRSRPLQNLISDYQGRQDFILRVGTDYTVQ